MIKFFYRRFSRMEKHKNRMRRIAPARQDRCRGQSLLELALALPMLMIILVGALDLGRAFYSVITITNASREGARYATWHQDPGAIRTRVKAEALNSGITISDSQILINPNCGLTPCDVTRPITVTVNYQFEPIVAAILGSSIPFSRSTEMMMVVMQP